MAKFTITEYKRESNDFGDIVHFFEGNTRQPTMIEALTYLRDKERYEPNEHLFAACTVGHYDNLYDWALDTNSLVIHEAGQALGRDGCFVCGANYEEMYGDRRCSMCGREWEDLQ